MNEDDEMPVLGPDSEWYAREDLWSAWAPILFNEQRLESTVSEVDSIISLLGMQPGDRVLDLCCGIGRHAVELARRGYSVVGVDRTRPYIERARNAAASADVRVEFVVEDMRDFCRPDCFDVALSMFTSLGYFEKVSEEMRVLSNVFRSLRPNGKFLVDVAGKEIIARRFVERWWNEYEGGLVLHERRVVEDWARLENRWRLFDSSGQWHEWHFRHRIYSAVELKDMLRHAGFAHFDTYGGLDGSPYDHMAQRLITVAYKSTPDE